MKTFTTLQDIQNEIDRAVKITGTLETEVFQIYDVYGCEMAYFKLSSIHIRKQDWGLGFDYLTADDPTQNAFLIN